MAIVEYKLDGSFKSFRNYWERRTKEELIRELWDAAGELETLERENAELRAQVNRLDELAGLARQSLARIKADALREAKDRFLSDMRRAHDKGMDVLDPKQWFEYEIARIERETKGKEDES